MRWTAEDAAEVYELVAGLWKRPTEQQWTHGWQGALGRYEARTVLAAIRELSADWRSTWHPKPSDVAERCRQLFAKSGGGDSLIFGMSQQVFRRLSPELQELYRSRWREELAARAHEAAGRRADGRERGN